MPERVSGYKSLSPTQLAWRRFRRNKLAIIGLVVVSTFILIGVFAPLLAPFEYDKTELFNQFKAPGESPGHLFGTDNLGRDVLSRLIWGARISLLVAFGAQALALVISLTLGFASGWLGGVVDFVVNRAMEVVGSLPGLLFQILVMVLIGNGIWQVMFAITILSWPGLTRLIRAQVLAYKQREFIDAARSLGANTLSIWVRHLLPNIINPIVVAISFGIPGYIGAEAGLSFLGYGINDPLPTWGKMVGAAGEFLQRYLYLAILPTLCLAILVLGFSFFGDGLRDALDPNSDRSSN